MPAKLLTKSKYLNGLQCPRYLWVACNDADSIPEPGLAQQHIFDQGHLVGNLAKQLYSGGTDLAAETFMGNIKATKALLEKRSPIYEAGLMAGRIYSRIDILAPAKKDAWDIVEVKSSTSVKDQNIDDVSFQKFTCEQAGLKINKCFLVHINNEYVKHGDIEPEKLFKVVNISEEVAEKSSAIEDRVKSMLDTIDCKDRPHAQIGTRCGNPFDCPLIEIDCWKGLPDHHVFTLYRGGKTSQEMYQNGIVDLTNVPDSYKLNDKQLIQCECIRNGTPHVEAKLVKEFLATLHYPLHFFDFETIGTAVPLFDGTRPYQNVPFQYSLHIKDSPNSFLLHFEHLAEGKEDPRPELLKHLKNEMGKKGSVVVYNRSFEQNVLMELGEAFPEYKKWADGLVARLVDLIIPFRNFHYYHPAQHGSASIKHVLPAVTGQSYDGMDISKGDEASVRYLNATYGGVSAEEQARTRASLIEYCGLDTKGMVDIVHHLEEITR